jgi:hypothetical protein
MVKRLPFLIVFSILFIQRIWSQNLILNPSNDLPLVGGEIQYWTEIQGTDWHQRDNSPLPQHGSQYFFPGVGATCKLGQTIDLTSYITTIDAGTQEFYFSGYVRSFDQSPTDRTQFELRFFSETNAELAVHILGPYSNRTSWDLKELTMTAPIGARSIQVMLHSIRYNGSNNDGYYDNLSLVAIEQPIVCSLDIDVSATYNNATLTALGNGAAQGSYIVNWGDGSAPDSTQTFAHTYAAEGTYTVCVTYYDEDNEANCSVIECTDVVITFPAIPCTLTMTATETGEIVNVVSQGTGAVTPNYTIQWGDGVSSNGSSGQHTYLLSGDYNVCVTYYDVTNEIGCTLDTCTIVQINIPVECQMVATYVQSGNTISVNATGHGAEQPNYVISWGDNSDNHIGSSALHEYAAGNYEICVVYTDLVNEATCEVEYCFSVTIATTEVNCVVGLTVTQTGSGYSALATGIGLSNGTYTINWGDNTAPTMSNEGTHTYATQGVYEVCVTYQDAQQTCVATECATVNTTVGIEYPENILNQFSIGPNPIRDIAQIHMHLSQPSKVRFDVIDALGHLVQSIDSAVYSQGEHTLMWDTSHLASGMYLVRASTPLHASYFKVIK